MSVFPPNEQNLVTHLQRFSLHDGPGIRTTVFLKGCPLRCPWCCNPEGMRPGLELAHQKTLCLGADKCGLCLRTCPHSCFQATQRADNLPALNRQDCDLCLRCTHACPSGALSRVGKAWGAFEIIEYCRQDMEIFTLSGGGITLSGGEPLARPALAVDILRQAQALSLHCALETCGWFDMDHPQTRECLSLSQLLIFDLKHSDSQTHRQYTGVDTLRIQCNLQRLSRDFPHLPIVVRVAVIPAFNAEEEVLMALARLAASVPTVQDMELIPYHDLGLSKYAHLGKPLTWRNMPACPPETLERWQSMVRAVLHSQYMEASHAVSA